MAEDPRTIGRYEVERRLGQGGMGRVWLARDTVLGRRVAIKVLRDDLALPPPIRDELIVRMGHEARAAAAVSHPNIVTLYDMGEDPVVGLFLVFEYVTPVPDAGLTAEDSPRSLRDRLKLGPLPLAEIAKLAREVGSALSFAHGAGVIHRDVKPENILFSRTGFKIADFGIARIPDSTITLANTVLGTPAYTAPEALSKGEFGPSSDQFSLAATLYEAASGGRAFAGDDAIATAGKVSSDPPPPLRDSIGPSPVVRALDAALARGLAKTPEARYASCADLGEEVARVIEIGEERRTISGRPLPTMPSNLEEHGLLEVERPPLSSRIALSTRGRSDRSSVNTGATETSYPSLYIRRRTHRFQNIAAGIALITIVVLVLLGRRSPSPRGDHAAAAGSTPSSMSSSVGPILIAKPRPKPKAVIPLTPSAAGRHVADDAAAEVPVESAEP